MSIVLGATLVAFLIGQMPMVQQAEQWTEDLRMVEFQPRPVAPDPNIVVVTITEKVLDQFPYRSPVDRHFLALLLQHLAAKHVRAIGLDILLDKPSEPAKDAELRKTIHDMAVPLVISYVDDPRIMDPAGIAFLNDFVPPPDRGMANVPIDADGTVREIFAGERTPDGRYQPGLARAILARLGIATPDVSRQLLYRRQTTEGKPFFPLYPANTIEVLPDAWLKDKIVLVGGDLSLTDRHRTPYSLVEGAINGAMPGIVIHAEGLSQWLDGRHTNPVAFGLAIALTALLVLFDTVLGQAAMPATLRLASTILIILAWWIISFALYYYVLVVIPLIIPTLALGLSAWVGETVIGRAARQRLVLLADRSAADGPH